MDRSETSIIPARPFWEAGWFWWAMAAASLVPYLLPTILPFNDLPNHVGRHAVFLELAGSPFLQHYYRVHWFLAGNLGIDLIVRAIGPLLGAEPATRLAVAAIAPLTVAGIHGVARAIHGRVPPSAILSCLLVVNWPLLTGFTNFCLSAAIALNVLALWIRLRERAFWQRLLLFAPLGFVTWVAHTAGWGLLGLGVLTYEIVRAWALRPRWRAMVLAPFQTLPFALMLVVTILWRSGTTTGAGILWKLTFRHKAASVASLFRERVLTWDLAVTLLFAALLGWFLWKGRRVVPAALAIALAYVAAFLVCPETLFFSGFADRRLLTYGAMLLPLAAGVAPGLLDRERTRRPLMLGALAALGLFGARMLVSAAVWQAASLADERRVAILRTVPPHSRIFALEVEPCGERWARVGRPDHIQQYAITRAGGMVNGMFQNSGLSQVEAVYARPAGFNPNMLSTVHDARCPVGYIVETVQSAMAAFPRDLFDYVWIIADETPGAYDTQGLALAAVRGPDRLYRVIR